MSYAGIVITYERPAYEVMMIIRVMRTAKLVLVLVVL